MSPRELAYLSALEVRQLYRTRALSPVEVTESILARIERLNPSLNAYVTVTADIALAQASRAERAFADGMDTPPLLGIPVSIKDVTPTKGIRTTRGSLLSKDWVPDVDPPVVERIYAAGAVLLGKTNVPEHGWKGDTTNRLVGSTHNPWRHGLSAGGSSGGAAAAVAAGLGPLAQGTDGAGSIRIPASFCGVFGLKPSFGLVPMVPVDTEQVVHTGPITRTVGDAALLLNVLAGPDARDRHSLGATGLDYLDEVERGVGGLRVAWSPTLGYARVDPEVARLTAEAARVFSELGCFVEEVTPGFSDPCPIFQVISASAEAAEYRDTLASVRDRLDPGRLAIIESGYAYSGVDVARANAARTDFYEQVRQFMQPYDLLLTPTLPVTAFAAGADHPPTVEVSPSASVAWTPFTYPFNLTGQPAATVPCGLTADGLPVGLQIVGTWRADNLVLRAARGFEEARPWARLVPPLESGQAPRA